MPYSVIWNNNTPVNGIDNNNVEDDIVREIRLGIHERMDDIVVDWTADPVVLPQLADALRLVKRYRYDADAGAGSRALDPAYAQAMLIINYSGFTDASGNITINFNELDELYNMNDNILNFLVGPEQAPILQALYQTSANDFVFGYPFDFNVGLRTISYNIRRQDGGMVGAGQFITGDFIFFMEFIPI